MGDLVTYRMLMFDSERWERFEHRPGDIVISTPPKSGTTWTQMLCALMIFDGPTFPATLDGMSPFLDMRIRTEDEVFAIYDGQTHRRFIKTHTPLDGLPLRDDVTYVVVGRDPRDVMISWEHHAANLDIPVIIQHRFEAVGLDDLGDHEEEIAPKDPDPAVRFRQFVEAEWSPLRMMGLANVLHHLDTGWQRRHDANVGMFHYLDYRRDLIGEAARLAELCRMDVPRERIAELVPEAALPRMRERADELVPDIAKSDHFRDRAGFFRSGAAGEWLERTTAADRARYDERVAELVEPDLARWAHAGGLVS